MLTLPFEEALRSGIAHDNEEVQQLIERHLDFMKKFGQKDNKLVWPITCWQRLKLIQLPYRVPPAVISNPYEPNPTKAPVT